MKTFHAGGRIGDIVFALWTMKALGGGRLIVSDFHQGNWSLEIARTMESFLRYQEYIEDVVFEKHSPDMSVDYDLHEAENDFNPEAFPECPDLDGDHWPGDANIARRYALHFGLEFDGKPWLIAPRVYRFEYGITGIAFHCPLRRSLRSADDWFQIVACLNEFGFDVITLGKEPLRGLGIDSNLLETAGTIYSSGLLLGTVSSCNAIAQGLGKPTLVEQFPGCFNTRPTVSLNGMTNQQVVDEVIRRCK